MEPEDETREVEFRWPRKGDRLIRAKPGWRNAWVSPHGSDALLISYGFKQAADFLVAEHPQECDSLVVPILFLYRHSLELELKELIELGRDLSDHPPNPLATHSLEALWRIARPILQEVFPHGDPKDLAAVEECLLELHKVDPSSEAFRYATTTKGRAALTGLALLDLVNVADVMEGIMGFMSGSIDVMDEYLQAKRDIGSYYGP